MRDHLRSPGEPLATRAPQGEVVAPAAEAEVDFARALDDIAGQAIVFFVLVVAAAEVVVGLGIIVAIMRRRQSADVDDISLMRG
jgi:NADH:ubiquinone oxidoreductase subunit K